VEILTTGFRIVARDYLISARIRVYPVFISNGKSGVFEEFLDSGAKTVGLGLLVVLFKTYRSPSNIQYLSNTSEFQSMAKYALFLLCLTANYRSNAVF
jgi:hypothetical protein